MSLRRSSRSFLVLAAIAFGPPMFVLCAFLAPIALFGLFDSRSPLGLSSDVPDLVALLLLAFLPLIAATGFSFLAARSSRFVGRALALYLGLSVVSLSIAFVLSASLAGASMAVAEGATSGWTLKAQELQIRSSAPHPHAAAHHSLDPDRFLGLHPLIGRRPSQPHSSQAHRSRMTASSLSVNLEAANRWKTHRGNPRDTS